MAVVEVSLSKAMKATTIEAVVTGQREAAVRMWLGTRLILLGARVIGCSIEISIGAEDTDVI